MSKARDIADLGSNDVLETSSTGLDVTGTVTADGITLDNNDLLTIGTGNYFYADTSATEIASSTKLKIVTNGALRQEIGSNGDVSFYEDTGTTAKMVWDASEERVLVGSGFSSIPIPLSDSSTVVTSGALEFNKDGVSGTQRHGRILGNGTTNGGAYAGGLDFQCYAYDGANYGWFNAMRIDSNGNVGIGTSSPASKLELSGIGTGVWLTLDRQDTNTNIIDFTETGTRLGYVGYVGDNLIINNAKTSSATFNIANAEKMRLDSSGNLLVGMTSTSSTNGAYITQGGSVVIASSSANTTSSYLGWTSPVFTSGNQTKYGIRLSNGSSQNFNFGQFTDSSGFLGTLIQSDNTNLGTIIRSGSNGVRLSVNASSWSSYSDERLKDISGNIDSALDKVDAMRGVYFSWKEDEESKTYCGLIAQEVEAVLPEVIDDDSDYKQVRYTEIIPLLVEAIKELKAQNKTLKARIETLENN